MQARLYSRLSVIPAAAFLTDQAEAGVRPKRGLSMSPVATSAILHIGGRIYRRLWKCGVRATYCEERLCEAGSRVVAGGNHTVVTIAAAANSAPVARSEGTIKPPI